MKQIFVPIILCGCIAASESRVTGQSLSIDWWTNDGGAGTSTGGVYSVSGRVGQPPEAIMRSTGDFGCTLRFLYCSRRILWNKIEPGTLLLEELALDGRQNKTGSARRSMKGATANRRRDADKKG